MRKTQAYLKLIVFLILVTVLQGSLYARSQQEFIVKSASIQLSGDIYFLNAVFEINLPAYISAAFDQGFELPLVLDVELRQARRFWIDQEVASFRQRYQLQYHVILDTVSLLNVNSGHHLYFSSLDEALDHLTVLFNYPILDSVELDPEKPYYTRLKLGIDTSELPIPLKSSAWWENDWDLASDWFSWDIAP